MTKILLTIGIISSTLTSIAFATEHGACIDKDKKVITLKSKDEAAQEKECKSLNGVWSKNMKTNDSTQKKEEAAGKSGGW
jgi:hypothetical protein